jgi:hypothetical protein
MHKIVSSLLDTASGAGAGAGASIGIAIKCISHNSPASMAIFMAYSSVFNRGFGEQITC